MGTQFSTLHEPTPNVDDIIKYLESKNFPNINDSILRQNELNNNYKEPIKYVFNKLYKLYNIPDGKSITPKDFKGIGDPNKFNSMINSINNFKKNELSSLVDNILSKQEERVNYCVMHGTLINNIFTVPKNTILIFIAPTNRIIYQNEENDEALLKLVKNKEFLNDYLKNPACLRAKNYCFKYSTILYPGQKSFELLLSGPEPTDIKPENWGFFPNPKNLSTKIPLLSEYINARDAAEPMVYIINSCRACNHELDQKLVEVIYYNEYICNIINKNKEICPTIKDNNQDPICGEKFVAKSLIDINKTKVPALDFSPFDSNNDDIYSNIAYTLRTEKKTGLETYKFEKLFEELIKFHNNKRFFEHSFNIDNRILSVNIDFVAELFSERMMPSWNSHIDKYFFDKDNKLIYKEEIKDAFIKINNRIKDKKKYIITRLILGVFMYYYSDLKKDHTSPEKNIRYKELQSLTSEILKNISLSEYMEIPLYNYNFYKEFLNPLKGGFIKKRVTNKSIKKLKHNKTKRLKRSKLVSRV